MISSKLENLNRLELLPDPPGCLNRKLPLLPPEANDPKLEETGPGVAGVAGRAVVCVMGTKPNSNLGLSQLFKLDDPNAVLEPVTVPDVVGTVVWVVDLVVALNLGPGRPPRGLTANPGPGPGPL